MSQPFAVRLSGWSYQVYDTKTGRTVKSFKYLATEASRAKAMGLANATRNDMNTERQKARDNS